MQKSKNLLLYEMLRLGRDCRKNGIQWLVRVIWNHGDKVTVQNLPSFLDEKAK